jgi:hypothetical protein
MPNTSRLLLILLLLLLPPALLLLLALPSLALHLQCCRSCCCSG